jgi:regulatory protein
MEQSRFRFAVRCQGKREGGGEAGSAGRADVDVDPYIDSDSRRNADARDALESGGAGKPVVADSYSRSSEQAFGCAKRRPGEAGEKSKRSLKDRALGYLSRREYSRVELAGKLTPYLEETDKLESVLDELEREGWLSDARFAENLMHRRAGRFGARRIVGELKRHALDSELLEQLDTQLRDTEATRAKAVWQKKFGVLPQSPAERAKQTRFLAARGFSHADIGRLLGGVDNESDFSGHDVAD